MSLAHGWHSRDRESSALDREQIGLVGLHLLFHVGEHLQDMTFV